MVWKLVGVQRGHQAHDGRQDDTFTAVSALVAIPGVDPRDDRHRWPPLCASARRYETDLVDLSQGRRVFAPDAGVNDPSVGVICLDILPPTWIGVTAVVALLLAAAVLLRRCSSATAWSPRQIAALAAGALVGRTIIGFLAPPADGVNLAAKLSQNALLLVLMLVLAWLVQRQRPAVAASHSTSPVAAPSSGASSETQT
jgi:hypothetical protein